MVKLLLPDIDFYHYCPQRSCGKVMFLHLSVILFTGGGVPQCMLGYTHPLQVDTPWADTPLARPPPRPVYAGIHTPLPSACWDTHSLPSAFWDTPPCPVHAG